PQPSPHPHTFPTRRPSDLAARRAERIDEAADRRRGFRGQGWQTWLFPPMAPTVLRMGKHMPDIDLFPVVMYGSNQAIFVPRDVEDRKSTRLNSSHEWISYA